MKVLAIVATVTQKWTTEWLPLGHRSDQWYYPEGTGVRMEEADLISSLYNASEDPLDSTVNLNIQETVNQELYLFLCSQRHIHPGGNRTH